MVLPKSNVCDLLGNVTTKLIDFSSQANIVRTSRTGKLQQLFQLVQALLTRIVQQDAPHIQKPWNHLRKDEVNLSYFTKDQFNIKRKQEEHLFPPGPQNQTLKLNLRTRPTQVSGLH
jgi:hypothetical protein